MNSNTINECINVIISYLSYFIGKKNIISVILTGSAARNQASYRQVDGNIYLESDLDLILVVKYVAIIKSLILVKRLSKKITSDLNKRKLLLSHVSFSVTTEKALLDSGPSIFYQDLSLNGKVIYGKDIRSSFRGYEIKEIPTQDLYRLLFNRMIESLEALVLSGTFEGKLTEYSFFNLILKSLKKLNFALIQVILIKEGILIFNISDIRTANAYQLKNQQVLDCLLNSYNELTSITKSKSQSQENDFYMHTIEKCWYRIISQFNLTMKFLYRTDDSSSACPSTDISPVLIEKILFKSEHLSNKLKISLIIFLQYFEIRKITEILGAIIFVMRFGSDHIYFVLYDLFMSSQNMLKASSGNQTKMNYKQQQQYDTFGKKIKLHEIYSIKTWLKLYSKYLRIWKFKTGG